MGVTIHILGPVAVTRSGATVALGPQLRRLLALFAVNVDSVVSSDAISDALWPDEVKDPQGRAVRTYVARLRRALGDAGELIISTRAPGYMLKVGPEVGLDSHDFEAALESAREGQGPVIETMASIDDALSKWAGDALLEFAGEEWARIEAIRLGELRILAHEERYRAAIDAGLHASSIAELERLVAVHPLRDSLRGLLMLALHRSGRQVDALRAYQDHRDAMADAGLEPGLELRDLDSRISQEDPALTLDLQAEHIRGYVRGEKLREDALSIVWRAVQPALDRDVTIRQVKAALANRPEFIRAFEHEAQTVAQLEHPRVVPLYDFWREVGAAYLVMRHLRGGTLADAIPRRGAVVNTVAVVARHVGEALTAAHAAGVVHRKVSPATVFLDEDGNAYLGDFGIATAWFGAQEPDLEADRSVYESPEQVRGEPATPASDQFGLAISLYEALTGEVPLWADDRAASPAPTISTLRSDVPAEVDDVVVRATAADPGDRYLSVGEFVRAFTAALVGTASAGASEGSTGGREGDGGRDGAGPNPYRGLAAFGEADSAQFFGRQAVVDDLLARIDSAGPSAVITVVGPSGSGKSSVVRAGLIPALRRGALDGSDEWFVTTMVPGAHPFEELEVALSRVAVRTQADLADSLRRDERGIARAVKLCLPEQGDLVLVIDQFEELYTLSSESERRRFATGLREAVEDPNSRLRVVLTMRADFWDRPLRDPDLADLIEPSAVHLLPMKAEELEEAVVRPAELAGCEFEPGLHSQVIADVAGQPAALPLLQYALTELYNHRDGYRLTMAAYREMGGVSGALTQRAEAVFAELDSEAQTAARRLFGRLVSLGEGTEDTRRRMATANLGADPSTAQVLERYGRARLVSFDRDDTTREPTVEIAHEALLREWPRLRNWLDEDRADLRIEQHLARVADEWDRAGRPDSELYRGGRLESALDWAGLHPHAPTAIQGTFLDTAKERVAADRARERRRVRRLRTLATAAGIAAVIALVAGLVANSQRRDAEAARDDARLGELIAVANAQAGDAESPDLAMLLAVEAHARLPNADSLGAIQRALTRDDGFLGYLHTEEGYQVNALEVGGDGRLYARTEETLDVWDMETGELIGSTTVDSGLGVGNRDDLAIGDRYAFTLADGNLLRLRLSDMEITTLDASGSIRSIAISADSSILAVGDSKGVVELWSGDGEEQHDSLDPESFPVDALGFDPTGRWLLGVGRLADFTLYEVGRLAEDEGSGIEIDRVGRLDRTNLGNATGPDARFAWLDSGEVLISLGFVAPHVNNRVTLEQVTEYSNWPTNEAVVLALDDGQVLYGSSIRDLTTGRVARDLPAARGTPLAATVHDGVLALATTETISLWAVDGSQLLADAVPRDDAAFASVDPEGTLLVSATVSDLSNPFGRGAEVWDVETRRRIDTLPESGVAFWVPSGEILIVGDGMKLWDQQLQQLVSGPNRRLVFLTSATTSSDGQRLAYAASDGRLEVFRRDGTELGITYQLVDESFPSDRPDFGQTRVARFSRDGSLIVGVSKQGVAAVFVADSLNDDAPVVVIKPDGESIAYLSAEFSHDGTLLALWDSRGRIHLHDTATWELVGEPILFTRSLGRGFSELNRLIDPFESFHLSFSADDRFLLAGADWGSQMLDVAEGKPVGQEWSNERLGSANPADGARHLVTGTEDHILVWNTDPDTWPDIACIAAGRSLTESEWATFIGDEPYDPVCG